MPLSQPPSRPGGRLARLLAAGLALAMIAGCGDDEPEQARGAPAPELAGENAGASAPISGGPEAVMRITEVFGGEGEALIVGSATLADGSPPAEAELSIEVDGTPSPEVETSALSDDRSTLVASCACRVSPDEHLVELVIDPAGGDPIRLRGRSLAVSDNLAIERVDAPGLPSPLVAAAVETSPRRLGPEADPLLSSSLSQGLSGGEQPVLLVGHVSSEGANATFEAIQIDAFLGRDRLQPAFDLASPGKYTGAFVGEGSAGDPAGLTSATTAGSTTVGPRAIFACSCEPIPGY